MSLNELPERVFSAAMDPLSSELDPVPVDLDGVDPASDTIQGLQDGHVSDAHLPELVGSVKPGYSGPDAHSL